MGKTVEQIEINKYSLEPNPRIVPAKSGDQIFLTARIGNQQVGGSAIFKGQTLLAKGYFEDKTFLGTADELNGKDLKMVTSILDINPMTNMCVLSTAFTNQSNELLYSQNDNGQAPKAGIALFEGFYKIMLGLMLFVLPLGQSLHAQQTLEFDNLSTPASPGLQLLDQTPESVSRPTTPQGLSANLIGLLQGGGGALEFAPFWLMDHPEMEAKSLYATGMPVLQTLSVSGAVVKTDTTKQVAGGLRMRLFQKYSDKQQKSMENNIDNLQKELINFSVAYGSGDTAGQQKILADIKKKSDSLTESLNKPLWAVDLAAAVGGSSETNSYKDMVYRWSAWLTGSYQVGKLISVNVQTRYISNEEMDEPGEEAELFDGGARLNFDLNEKVSIAAEYLQRFGLSDSDYSENRFSALFNFRLIDNMYATATFGKNFGDTDNIIVMGGLAFGLSKEKIAFK